MSDVRNGCRILTVWLLGSHFLCGQTIDEPLVRTRIDGGSVCSLTGRWLQADDTKPPPIRAWAGIVVDRSGGPQLRSVQQRHLSWVQSDLTVNDNSLSALTTSQLREERAARLRHCRNFQPQYFDGVLLEFADAEPGMPRFCWMIDYDMDGALQGETQHPVSEPRMSTPTRIVSDDERHNSRLRVDVSLTTGRPPAFRFVEMSRQAAAAVGVPSAGSAPATLTDDRDTGPVAAKPPENIRTLVSTLHELDDIRVRKEHLEKVVQAADSVIAAIDHLGELRDLQTTLADALYRKARALGYMELPDVIAVRPVDDPVRLQQRFEATFLRLDRLVDTTRPDYILLRIRRERRRHRRGVALDLVETYRKTHPSPVWQYKKRFDLLAELGATLHAHQAAAEMWLRARMPPRPVPVLFRVESDSTPASNLSLTGDWLPKPPFRDSMATFQKMPDGAQEAVVWLDSGQSFRIDGLMTADGRRQIEVSRVSEIFELRLPEEI